MLPFDKHPGLIYVVATLLPLAAFVILLLAGGLRQYLRSRKQTDSLAAALYGLLGGDAPGKVAAYVATTAIGLAFVCSLYGFLKYKGEAHDLEHEIKHIKEEIAELVHEQEHQPDNKKLEEKAKLKRKELEEKEGRWSAHINWAVVLPGKLPDSRHGTALQLGFYIDQLSAIMFLMVTFIATLIHIFSIGYMGEELHQPVADHEVHTPHGHLHRRGRFGRFFLFLSLFCFSMLNLILADNLFQVFVSWELVGICSYLLIGFYYERTSASNAANKAFITNRIGDAGFILGLLIIWTYVGTLNFQEVFARIRCPDKAMSSKSGDHGKRVNLEYAGLIVRAEFQDYKSDENGDMVKILRPGEPVGFGTQAILWPRVQGGEFNGVGPESRGGGRDEVDVFDRPKPDQFGAIPYWLLVAAGLGVFLGCVGKSAQFPLHVWLPDAMEGPTPVSALIHAATMVAAGVYLVGRCFPLFTPEAQLVIAYTGAITLTVAASIAVVMTDIKKVLAYSTVSQLGYMMLALGVGGWVAGLFHLLTHAFFKALLFLGSGSVIYGCHHQQDMLKMGGLYPKMKITALTMLTGVLAIGGIPLFSGYYSKDAIMAESLGFFMVNKQHFLLFFLPLITAGITAFYMSRMWFLTFTGKPRDEHVHEHAHESPWVMTVPLIVLAFFSVTIAWGPEEVALENTLHHAMPHSVMADFGVEPLVDSVNVKGQRVMTWSGGKTKPLSQNSRHLAHEYHDLAGTLALGMGLAGILLAAMLYYFRVLDPAEGKEQFPGVYRLLASKWYFDELYSALVVRPALAVANWCRAFDTRVIDGVADGSAHLTERLSWGSGRFDLGIIDGIANLTASVCYAIGAWLRRFQTGYIRSYILFLVLAAVAIWVMLSFLFGTVPSAVGGPR